MNAANAGETAFNNSSFALVFPPAINATAGVVVPMPETA